MKKINWTTDKPTKSGWYWARGVFRYTVSTSEEVIEIVRLTVYDDDSEHVYPCGTEEPMRISSYTHWYGPLEVPEPPNA